MERNARRYLRLLVGEPGDSSLSETIRTAMPQVCAVSPSSNNTALPYRFQDEEGTKDLNLAFTAHLFTRYNSILIKFVIPSLISNHISSTVTLSYIPVPPPPPLETLMSRLPTSLVVRQLRIKTASRPRTADRLPISMPGLDHSRLSVSPASRRSSEAGSGILGDRSVLACARAPTARAGTGGRRCSRVAVSGTRTESAVALVGSVEFVGEES